MEPPRLPARWPGMMSRCLTFAAATAILLPLAACERHGPVPQAETGPTQTAPVSVSASGGNPAPAPSPPAAPARQVPPDYAALDQVQDPVRVLAFLAAALHDGRWADAARAWGEGSDATALQRRFGANGPVTLAFGPGESEGAAGSIYYSAPYTLRRANGAEEKGAIVLRRVNDVPGASQASLHWHVSSMDAGGQPGS